MSDNMPSPFRVNITTFILLALIAVPAYFLFTVKPVAPPPSQEQTMKGNDKIMESVLAAEKNPSFETFTQLGMDCYNDKQFPQAINAFKKATEFNPGSAIGWNNLAAAYGAVNLWEEEIAACEKALQIDPGYQLAKNNLQWAKEQLANTQKGK